MKYLFRSSFPSFCFYPSSSSESEEEEATEENATTLLKQLTKLMLINQKKQRKERKETQKLLKTLVKNKTTLTQHLDIDDRYTEANATSLVPLVANFPEICAFIIGFSFTAWTKKAFAGSLTDGVLADAILIPPHPLIPPTN